MSNAFLLATVLAWPLGSALLLGALRHRERACAWLAILAPWPLGGLLALLCHRLVNGAPPRLELLEPLPGISCVFEVEPLGMLFALLAGVLWIPSALYSVAYARAHGLRHRARFHACFAAAIAAALGIAFSGNLLTLFICYELLTLVTYPLVTHEGDAAARRAGRRYLLYLLGSSLGLLLPACIIVQLLAGETRFAHGGILAGHVSDFGAGWLYLLFVFGTGKAALMPLHRWLPAAMVAPAPVSALLHAVAVVKAGAFTILKVSWFTFGLDLLNGNWGAEFVMWVACFTIIAASCIALRLDHLKERLAYSTISQLSYIILGAAAAHPLAWLGGALHMLIHGFAKITLFFCAGAIAVTTHRDRVSELDGLGRIMPLTMVIFVIGALAVIGLPPGSGVWSKWLLLSGMAAQQHWLALGCLLLSSLLSIQYLLIIPGRAFLPGPHGERREAPAGCLAALAFCAIGTLLLFLWPGPAEELLRRLKDAS